MSFGFIYFWKSHTATVSGSVKRHVTCVNCGEPFYYVAKRVAQGGGHNPLHLNPRGATEMARKRAFINLDRALDGAIEAAHCPTCGIFQPEMVAYIRKELGKEVDPNKFANERLTIPFREAWNTANISDDVDAYNHFIEVWPNATGSVWAAKQRIKILTRTAVVAFAYKWAWPFAKILWMTLVVLLAIGFIVVVMRQ